MRLQFAAARNFPTETTMEFRLQSEYQPAGDQPDAIKQLVEGVENGTKHQTLLGVTGSGKTLVVKTLAKLIDVPLGKWMSYRLSMFSIYLSKLFQIHHLQSYQHTVPPYTPFIQTIQ